MTIDVAQIKKRLFVVFRDDAKVHEYLRTYGPVINATFVNALNQEVAERSQRREGNEEEGDDPIFTISVSCPVCGQTDITGYELRAKSQAISQTKFLVPVYKGASGYRPADYTLLSVTVCPRCLFASPDKKDFCRQATDKTNEIKSQLTSNLILSLQEQIGARKRMLSGISDYQSYFKRPRTDQAAIDTYRLAVARANVETWHDIPYAYYKQGSYTLRMAKIYKDGGRNNNDALKTALGFFEESFKRSECRREEIEIQTLYLIVALSAKLGEARKAKMYTGTFKSLYVNNKERANRPVTGDTATPALIAHWKDKIEFVRDSSGDPEYFKDE
ncbi:MAG: DUF2225 domain-containing protein [Chitinispirillaceae bacterium]|nr:DUF2225 domain-containing protein [Chitinispirillaceae bacterium]